MNNLQVATKGLASSSDEVVGLGTAFKGLGISIKNAFVALVKNPMTHLVGAAVATGLLINNYVKAFDKAKEKSLQAQQDYSSTTSEIQSINSELEASNTRISELQSKGTLTLTEQGELERLQLQNSELERQIELKESIAENQSKEARDSAMKALGYKRTEDMTQKVVSGANKHGDAVMSYGQTDLLTATSNELEALKELRDKRNELIDEKNNTKSKKRKKELESELESLESDITKFEDSVTANMQNVSDLRNSFIDSSTGEMLKGLSSKEIEYYDEMTRLMNDFGNIDLTPSEKALKNLDSFFSASSGRNIIKQQLEDAAKSGKDLVVELSRMGLTLDDLGIESVEQLSKYLQNAADSAQEAKKTIEDYSSSVSDVVEAGQTENRDNDWTSIQNAYKTAKELLKEGKTGTDDFQSVASFLDPKTVKEEAEKGGEYIADAYQRAFEKAQAYADRWFGEDQTKSMENFVNDFKNSGLFDVATDSKGLWDIDEKFKTTAEAAEEFGISAQAVETMLKSLEAYGYDFSEVIFSTEALTRYETALNGIKQIQKDMDSGYSNDRLNKLLPGWEEEFAAIDGDLSKLTEPQIIEIEFEYSLAQIQQEISKLQQLADEGGDNQTWAELNANKRAYRDKAETKQGNYILGVDAYQEATNTIIALQDQMKNATIDAQKQTIQEQISGIYDLQNAINDAFAESDMPWDEFVQSDAYINSLSNLITSGEEAKQKIADLLNVDVEDIKINVDADTSSAKEKLDELAGVEMSDKIVSVVGEDHATEVLNIWNGLEADDKFTQLSAEDKASVILNLWNEAEANPKWSTLSAEDKATAVLNAYNALPDDDKNSLITQHGGETAIGVANAFKSAIAAIPTSKTTTLTTVKKTMVSGGSAKDYKNPSDRYIGSFNGTAHAIGTANKMLSRGNAYATGDWSVKKSEKSLVGELGQETIVRNGKFFTVGDHGAELADIRKGDIIFNHKQTEELFKNGYVTSGGGRAKVVGESYATGTAYRLGTGTSSSSSNKKSYSSSTSKRSSSSSSKSKSSSAKSSAEKAEKATEEVLDWIKTLLERVARQTEIAVDAIDTAIGLANKQTATANAISKVQDEIAKNQQAKDAYMAQANSVGLSSDYINKINNGSLSIETITDESLKEKISDYEKYYEAALKCEDEIRNLEEQERELAQRRLENIEEYYDAIADLNKSMIDVSESKQELNEALGTAINLDVNVSEIKNAIKAQEDTYNQLVQKLTDYQSEFNELVANGFIEKDSDAWFEGQQKINEFTSDIYEASKELIEFKDKLQEIEYDTIQNIIDGFERAVSKIDAKIELMEARDEVVPESLYQEQMDSNNSQIMANKELRDKKLKEQMYYDVGSVRYQEIAEEIAKIDEETLGLMVDNEKLKDSIFELRFTPIDEALEGYQKLRDEIDSFYDLLNEDAFFDKKGNGTADLAAGLALLQQGLAVSKQEIADYTEGLEKLEESFRNGVISEKEYNEKSEEYRDGLQDSIHTIQDYSEAITDLYMTQMEKEVEATETLIDRYAEARDRKEKYFDFNKKLSKQQKSVDLLKAEIQALTGVNNAAAKSELKRLRAELAQEQESLDEMKRDHQNEILDLGDNKLKEDLQTMLEDTEYQILHSAEKQQQIIDSMLNSVVGKYQDAFGKINSIIGNTGWVGSNGFNQNQSELGTQQGAQNQHNNSTQSQSEANKNPSGNASGTVTDKIENNEDFNSKLENELDKKPNTDNRPVVELKANPTSVSLEEGKSTSISTSVRPNDAKNKTLAWKSTNTGVATVSGGTIKAIKPGSCQVIVSTTDGSGLSVTIGVTVNKKPDPPKPAPKPSSPGTNDGVPRVGDPVTFASGRYYYDSQGVSPAGSKYQGQTVYITKINTRSWATKPYHISTGSSLGNGDLGWVTLDQLRGYKKGTNASGALSNQLAWTQENGRELIYRKTDKALLTQLGKGDVVFNHGITENLMAWGAINPQSVLSNNMISNLPVHDGRVTVEQHIDNLLTVNGDVDKEALPKLEEILKKSCKYTVDYLYTESKKAGVRRKWQ